MTNMTETKQVTTMKRISIILAVIFAIGVTTSCVQPWKNEVSLALDNDVVLLPMSLNVDPPVNPPYVNFTLVSSTGPWEATIETQDGSSWCWLANYYEEEHGEEKVKVYIKGLKVVEYFSDGEKACKLRGNGYMPLYIYYMPGGPRYAMLTVRRTDTGEVCTMRLDQNKK